MSPVFISSVIGLALLTIGMSQVAPSVVELIQARKVETNISREEALMQQIIRYRAIENTFPTTMADLIDKGYWSAADVSNGFGGSYSFLIDAAKGLISISTTIDDPKKREQYLQNFRHVFRPKNPSGSVVTTTFVMPSTGALATPFPPSGAIPVSASAPDPVTNTYWYDTSGSTVKLKVSDGANWTAISGQGGGSIDPNDILGAATDLPTTATSGDVKYVYDTNGNVLNTYVYYDGMWVLSGGGGAGYGADGVPDQFSFTPANVSNVGVGSVVTTNTITVSGVNSPAIISASVNGGSAIECKINGGLWGACAGSAVNGTTIQVRFTSSEEYGKTAIAHLTVGGVSAPFSATTATPMALNVSPTSLNITGPLNQTSTGQITLSNTNAFPVSLSLSISQSGTEFTGVSDNCTATLAANGGTCTVTVSFNPGPRTDTISGTLNLGFGGQTVALSGKGATYVTSTGYVAKGYPSPSVGADYSGTCATGFIPVPTMTIPTGSGTTQTIPAHCVMQYPASPSNISASAQSILGGTYSPTFRATNVTYQPTSRAEGFSLSAGSSYKAKSDATGKPWVYISYYEAAAACHSMGSAPGGQQIRLQRESEWMAAAHNAVGVHENWTGGAVDSGDLYQGVNSNPAPYSSSGAQAASAGNLAGTSNQRTKKLTNGQTIWDLGGNLYQWTYHDFAGGGANGLFGNIVRNQTAAPYNSSTKGMGWIPDSNAGNSGYTLPYSGWSGYAPIRGGVWGNGANAGAFGLNGGTPTNTGGNNVGFRCTHP